MGSTLVDIASLAEVHYIPTGNIVNVDLFGPFERMAVRTICVKKPVPVEQTFLVDICSGLKDRYRFGFNGQEKVNEWSGIGNHLAFEARGYDSRTGRWLSADPIRKVSLSPYQFGGDNPLAFIDPDGNTEYYYNAKWIGSDNVNNGLIALVADKGVANQIKEGKYTYAKPETLKNGTTNNDMFVIDANVLKTSYDVLKFQLSKKGWDREFGAKMLKTENGRYRIHHKGIIEGPTNKEWYNENKLSDIDLPDMGEISIHGHYTNTGPIGQNSNADAPSNLDKDGMNTEEMSIIVGKKSEINVKYEMKTLDAMGGPIIRPEWKVYDNRKESGTIEIFTKDDQDNPLFSIDGDDAKAILKDYDKNERGSSDSKQDVHLNTGSETR